MSNAYRVDIFGIIGEDNATRGDVTLDFAPFVGEGVKATWFVSFQSSFLFLGIVRYLRFCRRETKYLR
jgi:hypothetical protein